MNLPLFSPVAFVTYSMFFSLLTIGALSFALSSQGIWFEWKLETATTTTDAATNSYNSSSFMFNWNSAYYERIESDRVTVSVAFDLDDSSAFSKMSALLRACGYLAVASLVISLVYAAVCCFAITMAFVQKRLKELMLGSSLGKICLLLLSTLPWLFATSAFFVFFDVGAAFSRDNAIWCSTSKDRACSSVFRHIVSSDGSGMMVTTETSGPKQGWWSILGAIGAGLLSMIGMMVAVTKHPKYEKNAAVVVVMKKKNHNQRRRPPLPQPAAAQPPQRYAFNRLMQHDNSDLFDGIERSLSPLRLLEVHQHYSDISDCHYDDVFNSFHKNTPKMTPKPEQQGVVSAALEYTGTMSTPPEYSRGGGTGFGFLGFVMNEKLTLDSPTPTQTSSVWLTGVRNYYNCSVGTGHTVINNNNISNDNEDDNNDDDIINNVPPPESESVLDVEGMMLDYDEYMMTNDNNNANNTINIMNGMEYIIL